MNALKQIIKASTGYWIHKLKTLPIGTDLFYDITERLQYGRLKTVFDVGANEGQTIKWIRHYQPASKIFSFEPVSSTFDILKKNVKGYGDCVIENFAFGEVKGQKTIKLFEDYSVLNSLKDGAMNHNPGCKEELITIETLDIYCRENNIHHIDLLKIDTEGYELNVLQGGENLLTEKRISFIYCEVGFNQTNQRNTYFENVTTFLAKRDYFFYALYQIDSHDWKNGNHLANALYIQKSVFC